MILASLSLLLAMTSAEAVATLLNSANSTGPKTFAEAKAVVEGDAKAGKPLQQFVIGVSTDDRELAARYLEASRGKIRAMAEKTGNPLAWYLLSLEKNDIGLLRKAADGGNVQALNALGTIVTSEAFARKNITHDELDSALTRCYGYFQRAAAQHDPNGFINLGTCYLRGFGCKQDMALAFECFKSAAELGHPEGMDNMSACYQFGHGVEKSSERSLYWRMRGKAARGDESAQKWLREKK